MVILPTQDPLLVSSPEVLTHSCFDAQTTGTCEEVWPKAVVLIVRNPAISSTSTTGLVRNANDQAPALTYRQ